MKPWSEENQRALQTLLKFYKEKKEPLYKCPLCKANERIRENCRAAEDRCNTCPWVIMTEYNCFNEVNAIFISIGCSITTGTLRDDINRYISGCCILSNGGVSYYNLEEVVKIRIKQLEEWIEYYKKA